MARVAAGRSYRWIARDLDISKNTVADIVVRNRWEETDMSIVIRKMRKADSPLWADMRLKLWDRVSFGEHAADIEKMLKSKKQSGYIAILADHQGIGFAEICIREYANGCSQKPVPWKGSGSIPNISGRELVAPS